MPAYQLTSSWQKIASAGQTVEIQNTTGGAAVIMTSTGGPPSTLDGIQLSDRGASRQYGLVADLYAHSISMFGAPVLAVMSGFALLGSGSTTTTTTNPTTPTTPTSTPSTFDSAVTSFDSTSLTFDKDS